MSLSIGPKGQDHIGGALFRHEEQSEKTGLWEQTPGKDNDRYGVLAKTLNIEGTDQYQTVFELRCNGKRRLSRGGVPYIKAHVYPVRKTEAADAQALAACF